MIVATILRGAYGTKHRKPRKNTKLEAEIRELNVKLEREINEKYVIKSALSKSEDMNKQFLKIIENLSSGIENR